MKLASYDSTWSMIILFALLILAMIAVGLVPLLISRVIRAWLHRRKIARERSIASDAIKIGELLASDNPEIEARAQRILATRGTEALHTLAHFALAKVDDRRGDFASMKGHCRYAASVLDRAILPPTEKDAREITEMREIASLLFAFALAACGDLEEAEERLKKHEPTPGQHVGLRLRAAALILARRKEWAAVGAELNVAIDDFPDLGPSSKLLLRVLKERAANGQAYRSTAAPAVENAEPDADEARRRKWVAKAIGEES